jgi:glycosyltransferase involved in cell wall biosynthesis
MLERFGFISTRFAGTDGVSLESAKWAEVLEDDGHMNFWYGGRLCRPAAASLCIPEAYFGHSENEWINKHLWRKGARSTLVTERISSLATYLKGSLYDFVEAFNLTTLIVENALSIPMHVSLGVAITEFMAETGIPAIGHHHDFYWERDRFLDNTVSDYLDMAFPPGNPHLQHVVINQSAGQELSRRRGIASVLIPNVLDFENTKWGIDEYNSDVREEIGLASDDVFILQPTRIIPRKGIEHSIRLVQALGDPKCKLVISHDAGDEGYAYQKNLEELAWSSGVDLRFIYDRVSDTRRLDTQDRKMYTLWDLYPHADFVAYPSIYEGFGNALLEAVYFRRPILVNRYPVFARDIEPLGFRFIVMDGILTHENVEQVRRVLGDRSYRREAVDHNYRIAGRYFGYSLLREKLRLLLTSIEYCKGNTG